MGTYSQNHLPSLQGDIEWDWNSAQADTQKYQHAFRKSRLSWHPLQRFNKKLQNDLTTLRAIYYDLLEKDFNQWANQLGKVDFNDIQKNWKRLFKNAKIVQNLYSQQSWQMRSTKEKQLLGYINLIQLNLETWNPRGRKLTTRWTLNIMNKINKLSL